MYPCAGTNMRRTRGGIADSTFPKTNRCVSTKERPNEHTGTTNLFSRLLRLCCFLPGRRQSSFSLLRFLPRCGSFGLARKTQSSVGQTKETQGKPGGNKSLTRKKCGSHEDNNMAQHARFTLSNNRPCDGTVTNTTLPHLSSFHLDNHRTVTLV